MAEKDAYPLAPANGHARNDAESAAVHADELRRKKRMKCIIYLILFVVFQSIVILVFALTVMKVKSPKFRVREASFSSFEVNPGTPSFSMKMNAQLGVKNTNFGHFKFDNSTIVFSYMGIPVGEAFVPKARARARTTKKLNVTVDLTSTALASMNSHSSKLSGKVHLMKVMKKKKSAQMNCTMEVNTQLQSIQNVKCK
ncbi:hypothetical protein AAG906_008818 [Vitis piasezkii]